MGRGHYLIISPSKVQARFADEPSSVHVSQFKIHWARDLREADPNFGTFFVSAAYFHAREPLYCIRTMESSRGGSSRRVHKIVYRAVKKGNVFVNF